MKLIMVDDFLTTEECDTLLLLYNSHEKIHNDGHARPAHGGGIEMVQNAVDRRSLGLHVMGDWVTFGDTSNGMHQHVDGSYQGGDATLLIYLSTVSVGGGTCFSDYETVKPLKGRAVVFPIDALHWGEPVVGGDRKIILAVEVKVSAC